MQKRSFRILAFLLVLLVPFQALADFQLSFTTDQAVNDVILMGDDNSMLGTVVNRQKDGSQTVWTLSVVTGGADSGYLYTKNADGNWIRGAYLSGLSLMAGSGTGGAFGKPWKESTYTRTSVEVRPLGEDERLQSRCGPAKTYHGAGAYKTYKMISTSALFIENGYLFVELAYQTVGKRILYFPVSAFKNVDDVPTVTLEAVEAGVTADVIPSFGPGYDYDSFDEAAISSGTAITVFFEENGWVFAEFSSGLGATRAWIPAGNVGY